MSKRTIKTGVGSYVDKRGIPTYGFQGQEVDVHDDFVADFDAVNVDNGDGKPVEYERVGVSVISPETVAAQQKADEEQADAEEAAQKRAAEDDAKESDKPRRGRLIKADSE
jgi:hypothetical protein